MEIYREIQAAPRRPRVAVLGFFDGMHRGHRALFAAARADAAARGCALMAVSFADGSGIKPGVPRLQSEAERLFAMQAAGADEVLLLDFASLRDRTPAEFATEILHTQLGCVSALCGYNFHFGAGGTGDSAALVRLLGAVGCPVTVLPPATHDGTAISAGRIRTALAAGQAGDAMAMLGTPYALCGRVQHGRALGRTMGYPTANLPIAPGRVLPRRGVYAIMGEIEGMDTALPGVANIGCRPTVEQDGRANCEVHFLAPVGDLYGKGLRISLLAHLRDEQAFENTQALALAIRQDAAKAKEYCKAWQNGQN